MNQTTTKQVDWQLDTRPVAPAPVRPGLEHADGLVIPWSPAFDGARATAFQGRLADILNGAALALMTSVGHRTGLFEVMAVLPPATPAQIATEAGLDEGYVAAWLGAMATGGVVTRDPASNRYALPAEHAPFLTRMGGPFNLAVATRFVGALGAAEDQVVARFHDGDGLPRETFARFDEARMAESAAILVPALEDAVLPLVPGLTEKLAAGVDVLDVGCGDGEALLRLARAFPASRFTGYDRSPEAIAAARAKAGRRGLANARFVARDVTWLGEYGRYDLITAFGTVGDQARPDLVLGGIAAALRGGGTLLLRAHRAGGTPGADAGHPFGPFVHAVRAMHDRALALGPGGDGLGELWDRDDTLRALREAGFRDTAVHAPAHDPMHDVFVATMG